jgi:uncharacterized membrane protein YidH (DUF202 family)
VDESSPLLTEEIERTNLANQRTLRSYLGTALALVSGGALCLAFITDPGADLAGVVLVVVGLATAAVGMRRYAWYKRRIDAVAERSTYRPDPDQDISY